MTEKEAAFPVEDFMGIDRQVDREDMQPNFYWATQNLWEEKLGVLETRGHSVSFKDTWPTGIDGIKSLTRIYKDSEDKRRLLSVSCTESVARYNYPVSPTNIYPSGVTIEYVADATAYFEHVYDANIDSKFQNLALRVYGYGYDHVYFLKASSITGYSSGTRSKVRISVASALSDRIIGIELYAMCVKGIGGTYAEEYLWAGSIDLVKTPTGVFDFTEAPISFILAGAGGDYHAGTVGFDIAQAAGGSLEAGKTYYVMVIRQHLKSGALSAQRCAWWNPGLDFSTDIPTITIANDNSKIVIDNLSLGTNVWAVAIGEHPQCMIPYKITNGSQLEITEFPNTRPALCDIHHTSATLSNLQFRCSDFSHNDMFVKITDAGVLTPVFCSRLHKGVNNEEAYAGAYSQGLAYYAFVLATYYDGMQRLGENSTYRFVEWDDVSYFVSDFNIFDAENKFFAVAIGDYTRSGTNYYISDGNICGVTVHDYQSGTEVKLPLNKFISKFQESIVVGGGERTTDIINNVVYDSSGTVHFTRTLNPHDFTEAGAGTPTLNFLTVERGGESIKGFGIYTNTSGTDGPISQFIIGKQNSLWLTNDLFGTGGISNLSKKVGFISQECIVNTPIGTIIASIDNVYLLRETGEPSPLGDSIRNILRKADMSNSKATYHDEQYKLAFYSSEHPGTAGYNNVELWLDIRKMKTQQGAPSWKGPMLGRQIGFQVIEDLEGDGVSSDIARDRYVVDEENVRLYKADVIPAPSDTQILDFATPVTSYLETKDFEISQQDNNWNKLITRQYWKIRSNKVAASPLSATDTLYVDGVLFEIKSLSMYGLSGVDFGDQPLKINAHFPTGRPRGRTLRRVFSTTDRIAIGGFSLFYKIEKRRII